MLKITPTLTTATVAGAFSGAVMPLLWSHLMSDSMSLVVAFLLLVALPVHAFVVGFDRNQPGPHARAIDTALLKRVGAWLLSAVVVTAISQALHA